MHGHGRERDCGGGGGGGGQHGGGGFFGHLSHDGGGGGGGGCWRQPRFGHGDCSSTGADVTVPAAHARALTDSTAKVRPLEHSVTATVWSSSARQPPRSAADSLISTSRSPEASSVRVEPVVLYSLTPRRTGFGAHELRPPPPPPLPGIENVNVLPWSTCVAAHAEPDRDDGGGGTSHTVCSGWLHMRTAMDAPQPMSSGRPHREMLLTTNSS